MALANEENMPMFIRCGIMALVAAYLNFLSQMIANPPFCQHVSKVLHRAVYLPAAPELHRYWMLMMLCCMWSNSPMDKRVCVSGPSRSLS